MILSLLIIFPRCIKQRTETVGFLTRGIKTCRTKCGLSRACFPLSVYTGSPLYDGGFGNVIKIIAEGENAEKEVISDNAGDSMLVDGNNSIRVKNAEALYLITVTDRTFDLTDLDETSSASQVMERFKAMESYPFIDKMAAQATAVAEKIYGWRQV